mgnify:CR=1 FL=1
MSHIQQIENDDYEANASYDYVREAFGDLGDSIETLRYEMEECAKEWDEEMTKAFGPIVTTRSLFNNDEIPF